MTFPKKDTHQISVGGIGYQWHLSRDWDVRTRWIVVRRAGSGTGQLLKIDPYHHDLLPTRGTVARAIRFALKNGWNPECNAAPICLTFVRQESGFEVAPQTSALQRRDDKHVRL